jgi:peptidoglycan/xylan/chitin deacetylase (PgdA/CDA1 family)
MSCNLYHLRKNFVRLVILASAFSLLFSIPGPQAAFAAVTTPLISLTFDDGSQTIYSNGYPILNAQGIPGTLFMETDPDIYMSPQWEVQLKALENHGWEIGSHSVDHPDFTEISPEEQIYELSQSKADLQALGLYVTGFAYPFGRGASDPDIRARVAQYYFYARSTDEGYNSSNPQKYTLLAMMPEVDTSLDTMKEWVDQAIADNTWLIFCLHEIEDDPTNQYSMSPDTLTALVSYIKSKVNEGAVQAVTVREALSLNGETFPGPVISNISTTPGKNQAAISWTTDTPSSTIVDYGLTASYATTTKKDISPLVTSHSITISGLAACTPYHYRLRSRDGSQNEGFTSDLTFTTTGCDTTPPQISNISAVPSNTDARINWTTDENASSFIEYGPIASYGSLTTETDISPLVTNHSVFISNLTACTLYHYRIHSRDGSDNEGSSVDQTFTTTGCDVTPPSISDVSAVPSITGVIINWNTDENASSFVEYGLTASYGLVTQETDTSPLVNSHSVTISGLTACTLFHYRIHSRDAWQNDGFTTDQTFTTTGCDITPPLISNVLAISTTTNITVNWSTDENASAFVEFGPNTSYGTLIFEAGTSTLVTSHSVILPDTQACTVYHYRIHSTDARQNEGISNDYVVTTSCYITYLAIAIK